MALPAQPSSPAELKERLLADAAGRPYLLYRDALARQRIVSLDDGNDRLTIGRTEAAELPLPWDPEVSRVHAVVERVADGWVLVDDGLSRNGSFVNHRRIHGRCLLEDGDLLRFGETLMSFRAGRRPALESTLPARESPRPLQVSDAQRRVLSALCRPYLRGDPFAMPASNQDIADELFLSVETVKGHLRTLFGLFEVDDLPRQEKRVRLVERAFQTGAVAEDPPAR